MVAIGPIDPKASNDHCFILVAIDHFTKWIEAASYYDVTRGVVLKFIKKEFIYRYGLPEGIIIDNAKNLNNKMMDQLLWAIQDKSQKFDSISPQDEWGS